MNIKNQIGEIVEALINNEGVDVEVYDCDVNGVDLEASARIDDDGDLRIQIDELPAERLRELFTDNDILGLFTEDEIREYLGDVDDE